MVITYKNIRSTDSQLLKVFFIESFGLYGRTTIKELLSLQYKLGLNLALKIHELLKLSGIAQVYYNDIKKLNKWVKFKDGKPVKYFVYNKRGSIVARKPEEK